MNDNSPPSGATTPLRPATWNDKYLNTLISLVDTATEPVATGEHAVTLQTSGGLITGTLVPQWQYAQNLVPAPPDAGPPFEPYGRDAKDYAHRGRKFQDGRAADVELSDEERAFLDEDSPSEYFLTLGWARFLFHPSNHTSESWIRVRRDDIIAWHPGTLEVSQ
ncbi:hypothetical protein [Janibacter hoylei]|uniref:hypothetical protein n=1 Tax=Janibacter hoylei TaxID=364298 RepID=UPI000FE2D755|nr:hypothetical protein [Janibacter hoylei]